MSALQRMKMKKQQNAEAAAPPVPGGGALVEALFAQGGGLGLSFIEVCRTANLI